ncbi:MAG: FkbM family methyltransferase [Candidatus Dependentiae bacterium]|nr:FkbM family methyltransferase [Candidatus Dependentiae bacterium]
MITVFKSHQALDYIKPHLSSSPIIIEAGAFDGRDTQKLAATWPQGIIHAFEPVPELFALLQKNTAHLPNVHCYQLALSDKTGSATFYVSEKIKKQGMPTQAGSLHKPKERLLWSPIIFPHTIMVPTITLDAWADRYHIDSVDFLWLDMQGHELNVLQAAPLVLPMVSVIYTEVGFIEAYERQQPYEVVKEWLESNHFTEVGRNFENQQQWFFGNMLLVRNT